MKRILLILVLFSTTIAFSQEKTFESEVKKISNRIDRITKQQKDSLREKVKEINMQLEEEKITKSKAEELKKEAATYHAKRIEVLVSEQQRRLQLLVQAKTDGKILGEDRYYEESTFSIGGTTFQLRFTEEDWEQKEERRKRRYKRRWDRRYTTQFVFAMGANNVLAKSLDNSPYEFWKSRFYEVGLTAKYRLNKDASKAYLKYGVSFLWNNLRAKGNLYHVENGDVTELQPHPFSLSESRLRHVQMIFPVHLEIDFSKNKKYDDGTISDRRNRSWRLGLGGFAGFKLGTRQYLEYKNAEGIRIEELQKGDFNTNIVNYGVSGYLAYRSCGLYVKYDLNPLFKDTNTRNISFGLRFDFD